MSGEHNTPAKVHLAALHALEADVKTLLARIEQDMTDDNIAAILHLDYARYFLNSLVHRIESFFKVSPSE